MSFIWLLLASLFVLAASELQTEATNTKRHCHDLFVYHQNRTSGLYQIDPDGDGGVAPFTVYCDMDDVQKRERKVVTVVHHDSEDILQVKGLEAPGSYKRNITYNNATEQQIAALIDVSTNCEQYIKWHCKGAMFGFWFPPETHTWWVGRNWESQFYWGGAATDSRTCACHPYCHETTDNSTCNCDANSKIEWMVDDGLLLDRARLPVLQLRGGDTGQPNEVGKFQLGALKCRNVLLEDHIVFNYPSQNFTEFKFTSPGYPRTYTPPFNRYHWQVVIPEGVSAEVIFPTYDVLHWGSYLSIPGCETVVKLEARKIHSPKDPPIIVEKQKNSRPYFVSDGKETAVKVTLVTCNQMDTVTEKGFQAEFRKTECPGCEAGQGKHDGTTTCNKHCGIIASYNYPYPFHDYNPPARLYKHTWVIMGARHKVIHIEFKDFDIPGTPGSRKCTAEREALSVYSKSRSGTEKLIGHYCNFNKEGHLYIKGHEVHLVFVTKFEKVGNGRGFHAIYKLTSRKNQPHSDGVIENVALGKPALQSSTLENHGPNLAVDGNPRAGSCISTNFEKEPWWRVDLQRSHTIYRVKIHNREFKMPSSANSVSWPRGQYGLPKPRIGCPATSTSQWESGLRYHDMECPVAMDESIKHWSDGIQLKGGLQEFQGIEQHFCIKTNDTPEATHKWMPGQYCFFRSGGSCPDGFRSGGFIRWTEKDTENNRKEGVLPDGEYDNYTLIHFCCRGDGDVDQPIRLPTGTPFYLLQYGIDCQRVEGMNHRQHFFHFCEDRVVDVKNPMYFTQPHPVVNAHMFEKGFAIHYCYYDILTSLRGFKVLVDNHGLISMRTRFWDNKQYGIAHESRDKFSNAYICIHQPVTEQELAVVDKNCTQPVTGRYVTLYVYDRSDSLQVCEVEIYGEPVCGQPLGMASEAILDWQISASSDDDPQKHHPTNGRLNHRFGWCANPDDEHKELEVDFGNVTRITGLVTQGLSQSSLKAYVQKFLLAFSNDSVKWWHEEEPVGVTKYYECDQCRMDDHDNDRKITYNMLTYVDARFLRFTIEEYKESPCVRIEILGCRGTDHCGGNYTAPTGTIMSPNHPYYYGQDRSCWWTVKPPEGKHVQLKFYLVELADPETLQLAGTCKDNLTVYPGPSSLAIRSKLDKSFPRFIVSNGTLRIHLESCFRSTITRRRGFYANYSFVDCPGCGIGDYSCAEVHVCTSRCGLIMSAGYPLSYVTHHRCRWHIRVASNYYINISVEDFDIDGGANCEHDYVDIYDGEVITKKATLLGRYCNGRPPPRQNIITNWNTLTIEFSSGAGVMGRGFLFKYTAERYRLPKTLQNIRFDAPELCPAPWKHYKNYCYTLMVEKIPLQWYAAERKCHEQGGYLVSVQDQMEMTVLHHLVTNVWQLSQLRTPSLYIGLTDQNRDGRFRWTDGNPMSYADWVVKKGEVDIQQPDGGQYEVCTMIHLENIYSTSNWHDIPCSLDSTTGVSTYICKKLSSAVVLNTTLPESFTDVFQSSMETTPPTPGIHFMCSSHDIVGMAVVCNGQRDCNDESDELSCGPPCPPSYFTCSNGRCISLNKYCDFDYDCSDGSDEADCVHPGCDEDTQFQCSNRQCIPKSKICDLQMDCKDKSDESSCSGKCQPITTFQCYDGTCIPNSTYCDGHYDCPGFHHEDEKTCSSDNTSNVRSEICTRTYKTCHELFKLTGDNQTGFYEIDPDGTGPLIPFTVECRLDRNDTAWTYVHHDTESRMYVRESVEGPGSYHRDLVYDDASWQQLAALVLASTKCQQMVQWQCRGAGFHFNDTISTSWWVARDGTRQYSWGARNRLCDCYPKCAGNRSCNCDVEEPLEWREDTGYLQDKSKLPVKQLHFGNTHTTGRAGFHTIGPLECSGGMVENDDQCSHLQNQWIRCQNGRTVDTKWRCLYEFDSLGYMLGCRDATHLRNCENFQCPMLYYKCPGSYCIPHRYRCNDQWDCPGGVDELQCKINPPACVGQYRCVNQTYCLPLSQLCDGIPQCQYGDDEVLCDVTCPSTCDCDGLYARCTNQNLTAIPTLSPDFRKLDISHNKLSRIKLEPHNLIYLGEFSLAYNLINIITSGGFAKLKNLYKLDLGFNQIEIIEKGSFFGLGNLKTLILEGNVDLKTIEPDAFIGLHKLPQLSIVRSKLSRLDGGVFKGLDSLHSLNLSQNEIDVVADGAFAGLNKVKILDLHGNTIREFSTGIFNGLKTMKYLTTDSFKFCCLAQPFVPFEQCLPQADEFSSCKDLMSNLVLRVFLWALGIVALIGNLVVIVWRSRTKDTNKASCALILSLGCADFLMGVYLIIVASVDTHYRGEYIAHSETWRESALCKAAGFLSTLSSEVSVFTLTFITLERLVCIAYPLSTRRFTPECTRGLIVGSWAAAAILAGLPLIVHTYFHGQFYARSGVCLALHITNQKPAGWEYSVIVFFCINLIAFLVILVAYAYMYTTVRQSSKTVTRTFARKASCEVKVGRQMALIVLTNFCCWMPIILMGLCAMAGLTIPGEVYAWTAVFILPLNSATNPIVYTLSSVQFKTMILRKYNNSKLKRNPSPTQIPMCTMRGRNGKCVRTYRPPQGYSSLVQFLRTAAPLLLTDVLQISKGICEALAELHEAGLALGGFEMDYIFVYKAETGAMSVYLPDINAYQVPSPGVGGNNALSEDTTKDMEDFGKIVKKMLQIYHVTCRQGEQPATGEAT